MSHDEPWLSCSHRGLTATPVSIRETGHRLSLSGDPFEKPLDYPGLAVHQASGMPILQVQDESTAASGYYPSPTAFKTQFLNSVPLPEEGKRKKNSGEEQGGSHR